MKANQLLAQLTRMLAKDPSMGEREVILCSSRWNHLHILETIDRRHIELNEKSEVVAVGGTGNDHHVLIEWEG